MKYVIEINDHPMNDSCTPALYRAKGFRALVFDQNGLNKLTPFETERAKAWNEGFQVGTWSSEQKGYDKGVKHGYNDGYSEGLEDGFKDGKTEGEEELKGIVLDFLRSIVKGQTENKFKPEVAIFDACNDCRYAHKEAQEMPCVDCKHSHKDFYERG